MLAEFNDFFENLSFDVGEGNFGGVFFLYIFCKIIEVGRTEQRVIRKRGVC